MWGVGHEFAGHGFVGAVVILGAEVKGFVSWVSVLGFQLICAFGASAFAAWVSLHCLQLWCRGFAARVERLLWLWSEACVARRKAEGGSNYRASLRP